MKRTIGLFCAGMALMHTVSLYCMDMNGCLRKMDKIMFDHDPLRNTTFEPTRYNMPKKAQERLDAREIVCLRRTSGLSKVVMEQTAPLAIIGSVGMLVMAVTSPVILVPFSVVAGLAVTSTVSHFASNQCLRSKIKTIAQEYKQSQD